MSPRPPHALASPCACSYLSRRAFTPVSREAVLGPCLSTLQKPHPGQRSVSAPVVWIGIDRPGSRQRRVLARRLAGSFDLRIPLRFGFRLRAIVHPGRLFGGPRFRTLLTEQRQTSLRLLRCPPQTQTLQRAAYRRLPHPQTFRHLPVRHARIKPLADQRVLALVQLAPTSGTSLGHQAVNALLLTPDFPTALGAERMAKRPGDFRLRAASSRPPDAGGPYRPARPGRAVRASGTPRGARRGPRTRPTR